MLCPQVTLSRAVSLSSLFYFWRAIPTLSLLTLSSGDGLFRKKTPPLPQSPLPVKCIFQESAFFQARDRASKNQNTPNLAALLGRSGEAGSDTTSPLWLIPRGRSIVQHYGPADQDGRCQRNKRRQLSGRHRTLRMRVWTLGIQASVRCQVAHFLAANTTRLL